jgi:diguanylate cyclase (GGDEF)-like protein
MKIRGFLIFCFLWPLATWWQIALATNVLGTPGAASPTWTDTKVLYDKRRDISLGEALRRVSEFIPLEDPAGRNLSFQDTPTWLLNDVTVTAPLKGWVMRFDYFNIDRLDVFFVRSTGDTTHLNFSRIEGRSGKDFLGLSPALALDLEPGQYKLLLRAESTHPILASFNITDGRTYRTIESKRSALRLAIIGGFVFLFCCHFVFFVQTRRRMYAANALNVAGLAIASASYAGVVDTFSPWLWGNMHSLEVGAALALLGAIWLMVGGSRPASRPWLQTIRWVTRGAAVLYLLGFVSPYYALSVIGGASFAAYLIFIGSAALDVASGAHSKYWVIAGWSCRICATSMIGMSLFYGSPYQFDFEITANLLAFAECICWMLYTQQTRLESAAKIERLERELKMRNIQAVTDGLTGCLNRGGITTKLKELVQTTSREDDRYIAVLLIDLDGFKKINDTEGHDVGDVVLREVAKRISGNLRTTDDLERQRGSDFLGRLGGDEFVLLGDVESLVQAQALGARLLHLINRPIDLGSGKKVSVGMTVGLSMSRIDSTDADELLTMADRALYVGKRNGKNKVVRYSSAADVQTTAASFPLLQPSP